MKIETFEHYRLVTYDDGTYGYVMADGTSKQGYKSKDGAKKAAKKLATSLQVMPYSLTAAERRLANKISKLYDEAAQYLKDKATDFVSKYDTGAKWDTDALNALIKQLTAQIAKTNADAVAAINGYAPVVAAEQANFTEYTIENGTTLNPSFTLINQDTVIRLLKDSPDVLPKAKAKIDKNKRWNTPKIRNALSRAIVQGDSIPKLSKELEQICGSNKAISVRNARTMMTGARNAGSMVAYRRAEAEGIHIQKQWLAALDERTRASHRHLDGEIKPLNELFSNGLDHPGDTHGRPEEVYNCRCTTVPIVNDQMYTGPRASKLKDMSYEDWKNEQPKPDWVIPKKVAPKSKKATAPAKPVTTIPTNKEMLTAALEKASNDLYKDLYNDAKRQKYYDAVKALSEYTEFGETVADQLTKKHILKMKSMIDDAEKAHPEIAAMYKVWQSQFAATNETNGAYYDPQDRKVHINLRDVPSESRTKSPYNTVFHEIGHLIDNCAACPKKGYKTLSNDLRGAIINDWEVYRKKMVTEYLGAKRASQLGEDDMDRYAVEYMQKLACNPSGGDIKTAKWYGRAINARKWADVSDIVEGCTYIDYPFGVGHGASYHMMVSKNTPTEFFAEVCSAAITSPESYEFLSEVFPTAVAQLLEIVKGII